WGQWSGCDVSCGNGTRSRARSCDNPAPAQGGDDCVGPKHDQDVCVLQTCQDGWDSWSTWSSCSVTCGPGLKHRHRTCNDTMGKALGGGCIGTDQEYAECNITVCDTIVLFYAHGARDRDISTNEKIVYGTITTNKGGGYNSSSGVFVAPYEGLYLFTSQTCTYANNNAYTGIIKDGVVLQTSLIHAAGDVLCSSIQAAVELRVGERVWVQGT
ncbi:CADN-like protein, partial [Mya arenaria]